MDTCSKEMWRRNWLVSNMRLTEKSAMDFCLIPFKRSSISENALLLKLFEYMACEKPIISTELPGIKAVVGNKVMYAANEDEYKEKIDTWESSQ